jgi:hypothetical protein
MRGLLTPIDHFAISYKTQLNLFASHQLLVTACDSIYQNAATEGGTVTRCGYKSVASYSPQKESLLMCAQLVEFAL